MSDLINEHLKECDICYLNKDPNDFYILKCCKNYSICKVCIEFLIQPKCPFCREPIEDENIALRNRRSSSISSPDEFFRPIADPSPPISYHHVESYDDTYNYSRIYRRRMRRYTKLRQRELLSIRNRQQTISHNSQQRKKDRDMKKMIKDGINDYNKKKKE